MDHLLHFSQTAMRLLRVLGLAALLAGPISVAAPASPAHAEADTKAKKPRRAAPPYKVVRVLPETTQALLFDKKRGTHVLVGVGHQLPGWAVVEIEDDQVVLTRASDGREFVLVAPGDAGGAGAPGAPATKTPAPVADPYADPAAPAPGALLDPYAGVLDPYGSEGVREVRAPEGQRASDPPPPESPKADKPKADPPKADKPKADPPKTDKPAAPPVEAPRDATISISRAELDAALGDFVKIGREVDMAVVAAGIELRRVAAASFFHRMGLRAGDLIKKVDGKVIKNLDDAAGVYARLGKASSFAVELVRAGTTITIRYQITK